MSFIITLCTYIVVSYTCYVYRQLSTYNKKFICRWCRCVLCRGKYNKSPLHSILAIINFFILCKFSFKIERKLAHTFICIYIECIRILVGRLYLASTVRKNQSPAGFFKRQDESTRSGLFFYLIALHFGQRPTIHTLPF